MGDRLSGLRVPEPHAVVDPLLPDGTPQERMGALYRVLGDEIASIDLPVVYAGDCVSTIGVLAGLERRNVEPTMLFFDAHGDFHTWETTASDFIGGMPLAMVTGRGEPTIVAEAGLSPLADERAILVDGRDLDPGEDQALLDSGVAQCAVTDVVRFAPDNGPLYIHVDLDVVDPSEMPAMNYPSPGGPLLGEVAEAVRSLAATGRVVAFSLSSWNPALPGADTAADAADLIATPFLPG